MREVKPARNHKDRVFRVLFREKKEVLGLYNAVNGTNYRNTDDMTITTLEHAIYVGMKNDVSFILYDEMMLYEHQSTDNPNIPLRNLFYVANLYSALVPEEKLYSSKAQKIPEPKFVVFYNGQEHVPERFEYKLSDLYQASLKDESRMPELELKVLVLNINEGYNEAIKEKCIALKGYTIFVEKVRRYNRELPARDAIEQAVDECIKEDVLAEFFRRNRAEVLSVGIFEFDEEKYRAVIREDAREDGFAEGQAQGLALGKAEGQALGKAEGQVVGARALIEICQEFGISKEATFEKVIEKFSIDREQGEKYIEKYWKE